MAKFMFEVDDCWLEDGTLHCNYCPCEDGADCCKLQNEGGGTPIQFDTFSEQMTNCPLVKL